jgi:hypothetical protein
LRIGAGWIVDHNDKDNIVQEHFENIMANPPSRSYNFNWPLLQLESLHLSDATR